MMYAADSETIENVRRTAERGLKKAQGDAYGREHYVDLFQHILDELERVNDSPL